MKLSSKLLDTLLQHDLSVYLVVGGLTLLFFYLRKREKKSQEPKSQNKQAKEWDTSRNAELKEEEEDFADFDLAKLVPPAHEVDTEHVPYIHTRYNPEESLKRAEEFYKMLNARRSVRFFTNEPVDKRIIDNIILTAGTAPSGAHTEPWTFVAIQDQEIKEKIREVIEAEEEINYMKRMGEQWVYDLKCLKTNWIKEYLTTAPWIIAVFRQAYFPLQGGRRRIHYYNEISASISVGLLLAAVQNAGLTTVTTTPLNCGPALRRILERPTHEKLVFILPVGYPSKEAAVPDLKRKPLSQTMITI